MSDGKIVATERPDGKPMRIALKSDSGKCEVLDVVRVEGGPYVVNYFRHRETPVSAHVKGTFGYEAAIGKDAKPETTLLFPRARITIAKDLLEVAAIVERLLEDCN